MITTRSELREYIECEKKRYFPGGGLFKEFLIGSNTWWIWRYQWHLRHSEFYYNMWKEKGAFIYKIFLLLHRREKNRIGRKVGLEISENSVECGLRIYHPNVVINPTAKVGKNCTIVGNLCIGNVNKQQNTAATIGNHVVLGYGCIILGNIFLADNVKVGAGGIDKKCRDSRNFCCWSSS